jgi:hypothetical protein
MRNQYFLMNDAGTGDAGGGTGGAGGAGGGTPSYLHGEAFLAAIPEEFKQHTSLAPIKDMKGLVSSFINAQSMVGADKIVLPKADAGDEAWQPVFEKLGRPKTAAEYAFKAPQLPEGLPFTPEDDKYVRELFHEAGLTNKQAERVLTKYLGRQVEEFKKQQDAVYQAKQAFTAELQRKYGNELDTKLALASQTVKRLGGEKLAELMDSTGLGDHPEMVNLFITLGDLLANDQVIRDKFVNSGFISNRDESLGEIAKLNMDKDFMTAYTSAEHPNHKAAVERMEKLYAIAYPGKTAPA